MGNFCGCNDQKRILQEELSLTKQSTQNSQIGSFTSQKKAQKNLSRNLKVVPSSISEKKTCEYTKQSCSQTFTFEVSDTSVTRIVSVIKGFLFRKRFRKYIKQDLLCYQNELKNKVKLKYRINIEEINFSLYIVYERYFLFNSDIDFLLSNAKKIFFGKITMQSLNQVNFTEGALVDVENEELFIGTLSSNKKKTGLLRKPNGDVFKGSFDDAGLYTGFGEYNYQNGDLYIGHFSKGKFNKFGLYKWNDGGYYKGEYKNGLKHGKGLLLFSNGALFTGTFLHGKIHGKGWFTKKNKFDGPIELNRGMISHNSSINESQQITEVSVREEKKI